jgi:hypothetical protein
MIMPKARYSQEQEKTIEQLRCTGTIIVRPLGLDRWAVRAVFMCQVRGTKKVELVIHDTDGKKHKLTVEGDKSIGDIQEILRQKWKLALWIKLVIQRSYAKAFFVEDKANYTVVSQ